MFRPRRSRKRNAKTFFLPPGGLFSFSFIFWRGKHKPARCSAYQNEGAHSRYGNDLGLRRFWSFVCRFGTGRTCRVALQMSAFDPKRTSSDEAIPSNPFNWVRKGCPDVGDTAKRPRFEPLGCSRRPRMRARVQDHSRELASAISRHVAKCGTQISARPKAPPAHRRERWSAATPKG